MTAALTAQAGLPSDLQLLVAECRMDCPYCGHTGTQVETVTCARHGRPGHRGCCVNGLVDEREVLCEQCGGAGWLPCCHECGGDLDDDTPAVWFESTDGLVLLCEHDARDHGIEPRSTSTTLDPLRSVPRPSTAAHLKRSDPTAADPLRRARRRSRDPERGGAVEHGRDSASEPVTG